MKVSCEGSVRVSSMLLPLLLLLLLLVTPLLSEAVVCPRRAGCRGTFGVLDGIVSLLGQEDGRHGAAARWHSG